MSVAVLQPAVQLVRVGEVLLFFFGLHVVLQNMHVALCTMGRAWTHAQCH